MEQLELQGAFDVEAAVDSEIFMDSDSWNSGVVSVNSKLKDSGEPVDGVVLQYACGPNSAVVGTTKLDEEASIALSSSAYPICIDGILSGSKPGYYVIPKKISTLMDLEQNIDLELYEEKPVVVEFKKYILDKDDSDEWFVKTSSLELDSNDSVQLIMTEVQNPSKPYQSSIILEPGVSSSEINLVPGLYNAEAFLTIEEFTMPKQEYEVDGETEVIEEQAFEKFYVGGFISDEQLIISSSNIESGTLQIPLIAINENQLESYEDLDVIDELEDFISENPDIFKLEFS
jgi:hypothetical protein